MSEYKVDRERLEAHSTEQILRILREERDDYTPEAIRIFEDIIRDRGLQNAEPARAAVGSPPGRTPVPITSGGEKTMIRNPTDAVHVLNDLLGGVLDGTVDPQAAAVAANIVMAILRALEQEFMTDTGESQ
jgi:hypothetical protein